MDIEFDFKGDPIGGVITNCKYIPPLYNQNYAQAQSHGAGGGGAKFGWSEQTNEFFRNTRS